MLEQGARRAPVEGGGGHHDHDGDQRGDGDLRDPGFEQHHEDQQERAREQRGQAAQAAVAHVADALADHAAACDAAEEARGDVGEAEAAAFAVLGAGGVGEFIDHAGRHHRFEQTDHGDRQCGQGDELERFQRERHIGQGKAGQALRQCAEVGHGLERQVQPLRDEREHDDADQRRRHDAGDARQAVDDDQPQRKHGPCGAVGIDQMRQLRGEDEDGERVDKAGAHRARDKAHEHAEPQPAKDDLHDARQHTRRQQILQAMRVHERCRHQRDRTGCGGHHRRPAAKERDHDADDERGEQSDRRIDARDEGERDDFGNQRKGGHRTGHEFARNARCPFGAREEG